jgi:glycosyltransferase involved in cell wall biosynthesis
MTNALYLSYDGITDPLGQSQVVPYVEALSRRGYKFTLVSFEKDGRFREHGSSARVALESAGIAWHPLIYTKHPPVLSTVWDVFRLRRIISRLHSRVGFDLVHCRGYITMLAATALEYSCRVPVIFDMRGFWADEKLDAGAWPQDHPVYRRVYEYFKRQEAKFLATSDGIVVLTEAGMRMLPTLAPVNPVAARSVITCSVDFDLFTIPENAERERVRLELGIGGATQVVAYLGSFGTWYMLDEMMAFYRRLNARCPDTRFMLVTPDNHEEARIAARRQGVDPNSLIIRTAQRRQVREFLAAVDIGLFFIRPTFSKVASAPTKLGEYLAMGIPVVTNDGVGDVSEILRAGECGAIVSDFSAPAYDRAINHLDALACVDRVRLRAFARTVYDLTGAVDKYEDLYRAVVGRACPASEMAARDARLATRAEPTR